MNFLKNIFLKCLLDTEVVMPSKLWGKCNKLRRDAWAGDKN